ncbi:MAG: hypothetical protein ABGW69_02470 [Nanoarchaeota archaeon]
MKIVYNVGVSDAIVYLLNKYKEKQIFRPNNLYDLTKTIFETLKDKEFKLEENNGKIGIDLSQFGLEFDNEIFYYLEFPLIQNFLEFEEFILVGTEQKERNQNSAKDTYYLAKILELVLRKKGKKVKVIKLSNNPVELKAMFSFYKKIIEEENPDYFNITTGTPIQSIAISLLAYKFDKKVVYKPWNNKGLEIWDIKKLVEGD